ncbi:sugar transferase [Asticcacaulis benevestitus]|nr:sugar transferase [Asticcacaulis benevestitus]
MKVLVEPNVQAENLSERPHEPILKNFARMVLRIWGQVEHNYKCDMVFFKSTSTSCLMKGCIMASLQNGVLTENRFVHQRTVDVSPRLPTLNELAIRIFDIVISLSAILFLAPALIVVAILVKLQDQGPIFFAQRRIGRDGREFPCFKFRSMRVDAAELLKTLLATDAQARAEWAADHKLRNDPRITALGRFLRKSSIDELPQLFNVLRGDMSLVGPRPIIQAEIVKYGRSFDNYVSVLPGITGLWQVMGRNDVTYNRRVAMDRLFARKRSFLIYIMILVMTVPAVFAQRGSY